MSLVLRVDGERWRSHLLQTVRTHPGIVPVAKGNGYGMSVGRLARRAQWLADHAGETGAPVDTVAVGTYDEVEKAASRYAGDLLVLTHPHQRDKVDLPGHRVDLADSLQRGDLLGHLGDAGDVGLHEDDGGDHGDTLAPFPPPTT